MSRRRQNGRAGYLVSGHRDLLSLADELFCYIVNADRFLSELAKR